MPSDLFDSIDGLFDDSVLLFDDIGLGGGGTPPPSGGTASTVQYRVLVADLVTNIIREELPISDLSYSEVLNAPGSMSGWISLDHPKCTRANLDPGATAVYIERGGLLVWGGILWTARVDSVERKLQIGAEGFWSYFRHRLIRNRNAMTYASGSTGQVYYTSADVTKTNVFGAFDNTNLYNNFTNEDPLILFHAVGDTAVPGTIPLYQARTDITAGALAGLSIISVQVSVGVQGYGAPHILTTNLLIGGGTYVGTNSWQTSTSVHQIFTDTWTTDPSTGQPWTIAAVEAFATTNAIGFSTDAVVTGSVDTYVDQFYMTVTWDIGGTASFTGVDQLRIVQDLLNNAQAQPGGNLSVTVGTEVSAIGRDAVYHDYERKNVGDAIEELAALLRGFDFAISVAWDSSGTVPLKTFHLYYPRRGTRIPGLVFNHNMAGTAKFTNAVDGTSTANQVDVIGSGDGGQMLIATLTDTSLFTKYLLMEETISAKDVTDEDFLVAMAAAQLGRRRLPKETPGIEKQAAVWPDFGAFQVGDEGLVVTSDGWLNLNAYHRVQSITINVGDEGQETMIPGFISSDSSVL